MRKALPVLAKISYRALNVAPGARYILVVLIILIVLVFLVFLVILFVLNVLVLLVVLILIVLLVLIVNLVLLIVLVFLVLFVLLVNLVLLIVLVLLVLLVILVILVLLVHPILAKTSCRALHLTPGARHLQKETIKCRKVKSSFLEVDITRHIQAILTKLDREDVFFFHGSKTFFDHLLKKDGLEDQGLPYRWIFAQELSV